MFRISFELRAQNNNVFILVIMRNMSTKTLILDHILSFGDIWAFGDNSRFLSQLTQNQGRSKRGRAVLTSLVQYLRGRKNEQCVIFFLQYIFFLITHTQAPRQDLFFGGGVKA